MNRRNLTAAVLAGLAGAAGIVGSAQAAATSIADEMFSQVAPDIVVVLNAPDAAVKSLGVNEPDTVAIHNIVVKEVWPIADPSLSTDLTVNDGPGEANAGPQTYYGQARHIVTESMPRDGLLLRDIVARHGVLGKMEPYVNVSIEAPERDSHQVNGLMKMAHVLTV